MRNLAKTAAVFTLVLSVTPGAVADITHIDDVIVQGSLCVGLDCVINQNFGFDSQRYQENNLRVLYDDTSNSSSFPNNDWRITLNDSSNGGGNFYAIDDVTAGRTGVFRIDAGAASNTLRVSANNRIGINKSNPVVDLHMVKGDTPTLRLEQDGSDGFPAQTWDVAGNEANFFVRDVTNGSRLPLRIRPAAPTSSIDIQADGDVGFGTNPNSATSAEASVHIRRTSSAANLILETTSPTAVKWEIKVNQNTGRLSFKDLNGSTTPVKVAADAAENLLRVGVLATNTVDVDGELVVTGNCTEQDGACADYVFADDYELRSLDTLADFIDNNKHLPNVPSTKEIEENGVNLAQFSGRLLEKIEELTLYTLQQQETIERQQATVDALNTRLARVERAGR